MKEKHDSTFRLSKMSSSLSSSAARWQAPRQETWKSDRSCFQITTRHRRRSFSFSPSLRAFFFSSIVKSHWKISTKLVLRLPLLSSRANNSNGNVEKQEQRDRERMKEAKCKWATCAHTQIEICTNSIEGNIFLRMRMENKWWSESSAVFFPHL